ncbi:DMT family transporter [Dechloromonas sp. ZY10]|uniref:DMT family transporter n=1 Tax=Dechloromonas aquae TaxID=2664436 RepID=UPI003528A5D1
MILLSTAGFGSMALFAHWAYADGASPATVVFLRFAIGTLLLGGWLGLRRIALPAGRVRRGYLYLGGLYALTAWCFFSALRHTSSGLAALLLYTYPIFVALFAGALGIDRFGRRELLALLLAAGGLLLALGGEHDNFSLSGTAYALSAALIYAAYVVGSGFLRQADHSSPLAATCVVLLAAATGNGLAAGLEGFAWPQGLAGWLACLAIGVFGGVLAIAAFLAGLARIGPTRAALLSTVEPLITLLLGLLFLDERLTLAQALGAAGILSAALLLTWPQRTPATT